ncbi:MAG: cupin domain-containing protein [Anaerolineae bacterium]|jgi:mannose-6-phosphate isomerase-like protein (cupin superfamily)
MIIRRDRVEPFDFQGLEIRDYTAGREISSSFGVITVPPGESHAEAWSKRSDKYYFVVTGSVEFALDGDEVTLSEGDLCIVARGQHFKYRNPGPNAARLCIVHTPSFDPGSEVFVE